MSYTYLQELGEESLVESFSEIPAFVLSKLNLTAGESCCNDNETESCRASQSGMTCEHSTANRGAERLTLYAEDSRARTSASQEKGRASKESEADSGPRWPVWFAKWSPASSSWKTPQCSLLAGLDVFSGIWPKWGMMRGGACWGLPMLEPHTEGSESGLWPTLVKSDSWKCHPFIAEIKNGKRLYTISSRGVRATSPFRSWLAAFPRKQITGKAGWASEPRVCRMVYGVANGVDRIAAIGNGQVPAVVALAWKTLTDDLP